MSTKHEQLLLPSTLIPNSHDFPPYCITHPFTPETSSPARSYPTNSHLQSQLLGQRAVLADVSEQEGDVGQHLADDAGVPLANVRARETEHELAAAGGAVARHLHGRLRVVRDEKSLQRVEVEGCQGVVGSYWILRV